MILTSLLLAAAGAAGAVTRYHTTRLITRLHPSTQFPYATLLINLTGSALLGALLATLANTPQSPTLLLLGTGFCGAFTTFSTFTLETHQLLHQTTTQKKRAAAAYLILTITGCLALFSLAYILTSHPTTIP